MGVADTRQRRLIRSHHHGVSPPDDGGGLATVRRQQLRFRTQAARAAGGPHLDRTGDEEVGDGRRRGTRLVRGTDIGDAHPDRAGLGLRLFGDLETLAQFVADLSVHLAQHRSPVVVRQDRVRHAEHLGRRDPQAGDGRGQGLVAPLLDRGSHHVRSRREPLVSGQEARVRRRASTGAGARGHRQSRRAQTADHPASHSRLSLFNMNLRAARPIRSRAGAGFPAPD
ncbi:hypothetical protein D3C87_1441020 [compost metagenome]